MRCGSSSLAGYPKKWGSAVRPLQEGPDPFLGFVVFRLEPELAWTSSEKESILSCLPSPSLRRRKRPMAESIAPLREDLDLPRNSAESPRHGFRGQPQGSHAGQFPASLTIAISREAG